MNKKTPSIFKLTLLTVVKLIFKTRALKKREKWSREQIKEFQEQ